MLGLSFGTLVTDAADIGIRDMIAQDLSQVIQIEQTSFDDPWPPQRIRECLAPPQGVNVKAIVAVRAFQIHGWLAYGWEQRHIEMYTFAVYPLYRRCGVGRELVKAAIRMLDGAQWRRLVCCVHERWLPAQLLLMSVGFVCLGPRRDFFPDGDALDFEFRQA
jgi:ribosomal protein S18 acetylase RimI-like enzyme